ncbi:peptide-methionine (S)-S-oxide reductase MsrA [Ureaplasma canigenitalium]|uniref:peptide-methionine (S)-S-oxide reductase MsrA n=1 Tax=Ureaplasma canigenitalium TaxID=42092 RepID=UPI0006909004|nr:peptide-methionine (S)-S-oxide reductase MsrA [Ureaplasma canigenitalium]
MNKRITLAGGCFWGLEKYYSNLKGVIDTYVGYANGNTPDPSYRDVCSGETGYAEVVVLTYDDTVVSLVTILYCFFKVVNPFSLNFQHNDIGTQYRNGIYVDTIEDFNFVHQYVAKLQANYTRKIVTEVEFLKNVYRAEEYHQKYLDKHPKGYLCFDLEQLDLDLRKKKSFW